MDSRFGDDNICVYNILGLLFDMKLIKGGTYNLAYVELSMRDTESRYAY